MSNYEIIRSEPVSYELYQKEADKIFRCIYSKLPNTMLFRFKTAKELSMTYALDIQDNLTSVSWVVISRSEKKLSAVKRYWDGIIDAIDSIEKIKMVK